MTQRLARQGEGQLAAAARWRNEDTATEQAIAQAVLAANENAPSHPCSSGYLAGDEQRLRGIPAIGRNVQGAIPGSNPGNLAWT